MLLSYLGLRKIIKSNINEYFVSIGLLSYTLTGKQITSQTVTTSILSGLDGLINKKYITHIDKDLKTRKNDFIFDIGEFQISQVKTKGSENYYSVINNDYIKELLSSDLKYKIDIIRFYCYLTTTLTKSGDKTGVGFTSYEAMADDIGISRQTISKYMDKLEELKIIYIYRSSDAICIDKIARNIPNAYGDIINIDKILNVGKSYEENYGVNAKHIKNTKKSSSRSASIKYNILKNDLITTGEVRYKKEELKVMYETLVKHNERYTYDESLQKDLSIFDNLI
jgi:DNA-binding transcriptional regulator YhcF (GntR family)